MRFSIKPLLRASATPLLVAALAASAGSARTPAPAASSSAACAGRVYIANSGSTGISASNGTVAGSISVVDAATNQVIATVPVGKGPVNPVVDPRGTRIYVSETGQGQVAVIDAATNQLVSQLTVGGRHPSGLAFTRDGRRLVVTLLGDTYQDVGYVQIVSLPSGALSPPIAVGKQPERLVLSPDGRHAYVSNGGANTVSVVDIQRRAVIATIPVGPYPFNLIAAPEGDKVYVGNVRGTSISVIDSRANRVVGEIATPGPNGLAFSPDHSAIYVTNSAAGRISVISRKDGATLRSGAVGAFPGHMALTTDGTAAYAVRGRSNAVTAIDLATLAVTHTVPVGAFPSTVGTCAGDRG